MKEYLSHYSAALLWNIPNLDEICGKALMDKRREGQTLDVTVTDPQTRYRKNGYISHTCILPLPRGAVVKHGRNLIASPELVFLELATVLNMHQLILLGLQMCAHPPGKPSQAISSRKNIETFLKKVHGHYGLHKAMRSVKFLESGSNSIMESIVFMIFTLPYKLGGFELGGARFNQEIILEKNARERLNQIRCYVDLYYPDKKLAIEYDSFKNHKTPSAQGKDLMRVTALKNQGIDVMSFATIQLYNKDECDAFVSNLASRLGKRIRIRAKDFTEEHRKLRSLLPIKAMQ